MASIIPYLDTRSTKKDGTHPVKIRVNHNNYDFLVPTTLNVTGEQWDKSSLSKDPVANHPQAKIYNQYLRSKIATIENKVIELDRLGKLRSITRAELKAYIEEKPTQSKATITFSEYFDDFANSRSAHKTRKGYEYTKNLIEKFTIGKKLTFEEITLSWLEEFERAMKTGAITTKPLAINNISIHMRNIRAVINNAVDNELTSCYPFRRFKIKSETTRKRSLTIEQLRTLRDYPCQEHQEKYRDMFMLMFYLLGINAVDLFGLKEITDGRVEYRRSKTGRLYSVAVPDEAMAIIKKYRGKKYLIDVCDTYANYGDFLHRMNKNLQEIGPYKRVGQGGKKVYDPLFAELSSYWARHTWATIAASLDIPKETIAEALGHEIGSAVTSIYIDFDRRKVDAANIRVIDAVNGTDEI